MTEPVPTRGAMLARWNPAKWTARVWLLVFIAAYALLSFELSFLRLVEFGSSNFDLGVYTQSLWSQSHGFGLFESADFETDGATSFLRIHPALIMVGLAQIYGAAPYPWTLFAIQSVAVALAAVPLYFLAKDISRSSWKGLLASGMYLVWAPLLAANLFDFHLGALLPVELLTLFLLWFRGRYLWATLPAGLACLTLEAGPVFISLIGLFFFLFPEESLAGLRQHARSLDPSPPRRRWSWEVRNRIQRGLTTANGRLSLALMIGGLVAYLVLVWVSSTAGTVFPLYTPRAPGQVLASGPPALGLAFWQLNNQLPTKILSWSIALALVAYLPLRAPKALLLLVPWVTVTFFSDPRFIALGNSDLFVAAFPVFVGVAYGLGELDIRLPDWLAVSSPGQGGPPQGPSTHVATRRVRARFGWAIVLGVVITANLLISPLDPLVQSELRGAALDPNGYRINYVTPHGFTEVRQLVGQIPAGSPVLASDALFPFVANNRHAFALSYLSVPPRFLPFNATALPQFFLMSDREFGSVPGWLVRAISDHSVYGLVGWVGGIPVGSAFLYELGYRGATTVVENGTFLPTTYIWPLLFPGNQGELTPVPGTATIYRIQSVVGETGLAWYGPDITLPPGRYSVVTHVEVQFVNQTLLSAPGTEVLGIALSALGQVFSDTHYTVGQLMNGTVLSLAIPLILVQPTLRVDFHGAQFVPGVEVTLDSIVVLPQIP